MLLLSPRIEHSSASRYHIDRVSCQFMNKREHQLECQINIYKLGSCLGQDSTKKFELGLSDSGPFTTRVKILFQTLRLRVILLVTFNLLWAMKVNQLIQLQSVPTNTLVFSAICPMTKSAVCADNRSISPPSADRYQLMGQNFIPGDDHITVQSGNTLHGGWKIGRITFPQPWHLGGNFGVPRDELIQGFDKAFAKDFPSPIRDRWFRSLEWFRLAHTETDEISIFSKIVMMATAFEILVQVPNIPNKKEWLAKELIKRCASSKSLKATRIDSKGKKYRYPKIAWWAWDFYNLRNKIVHGDSIPYKLLKYKVRNKKWLTHLIVADLIFWECLTRELYIQKCIGDHIKKEVLPNWQALFPKEPPEALENLLIPSMLGFNEIHRELGWLRQVSR